MANVFPGYYRAPGACVWGGGRVHSSRYAHSAYRNESPVDFEGSAIEVLRCVAAALWLMCAPVCPQFLLRGRTLLPLVKVGRDARLSARARQQQQEVNLCLPNLGRFILIVASPGHTGQMPPRPRCLSACLRLATAAAAVALLQ